ncbi:hypothetical protein CEXT_358331 [Caerostris extrusa]|uniref:Uncharacterized protein n=1 Tax=Caerostris extrusa TaxID=172846 RepID=A0AAV4WTW1_CAEEX|nr:hypothetical protein CEXT_358331 [Caerostris extrusa]
MKPSQVEYLESNRHQPMTEKKESIFGFTNCVSIRQPPETEEIVSPIELKTPYFRCPSSITCRSNVAACA